MALIAEANNKDIDLAVKSARDAYKGFWSKTGNRGKGYIYFRIARNNPGKGERVGYNWDTCDGGKPIRESRDIDVPMAAAHFFYYAGWADKLNYAYPNKKPQSLGVVGQIIPWNFPLIDGQAWKIAPCISNWQYGSFKTS